MRIFRRRKDPITQKYAGDIDHVYIACLECRFKGPWSTSADDLLYIVQGDGAELDLVELNGTRKRISFKKDAYVTLFPSNVITYE